ncbi:hypothetical protein B0H19DRAFT_1271247 [Mycena capillaripes]|nr:hypothetical protein B0H19DRAFT_1271247 [Mycena capillaripes]
MPSMVSMQLAHTPKELKIPYLASDGIGDAREGMAAVIALGAAGVNMGKVLGTFAGTRFMCTCQENEISFTSSAQ